MPIDASILLGYRPQQQSNPLESIGRVMSLKQMMDEAPIRQEMQQEQLRRVRADRETDERALADDAAMREYLRGNPKASDDDLVSRFGVKSGGGVVKLRAEQKKAQLDAEDSALKVAASKAARLASLAGSAKDQASYEWAIGTAVREKLIPEDQIAKIPQQFDPAIVQYFATQAISAKDHVELKFKELDEKRKADLHPDAKRKAKAEAVRAEQLTTGEVPMTVTEFERIRMQADENARRADHDAAVLAETRRAHNLTDARARVTNQQGGTQVEKTLRDDYNKAAAPFVVARDAYGRVRESLSSQDPMSDVALIYGYMKMLDPGSVVRETEFATAQNAAGVPDKIRNWFNNAREGIRLSGAQRKEIELMSDRLYKRAEADHNKTAEQYRGIATRSGANPANVLIDYSTTAPQQSGGAPQQQSGVPQIGGTFNGGKVLKVTKVE